VIKDKLYSFFQSPAKKSAEKDACGDRKASFSALKFKSGSPENG
jgi:hypothetical protein